MKKYILILLWSLYAVSCYENLSFPVNEDSIVVDIDLSVDEPIHITQFVDSVSFVKLETCEDCLIGLIKSVVLCDSLFFIHETKTSSILVFDIYGKYQWKISKKGKGPGEYVKISQMMVNEKSKKVIIYDEFTKKMIFYSFDGKFDKEIIRFNNGALIRDMIDIPGGFLCYTPDYMKRNRHWGIWKVDSLGQNEAFLMKQDTEYPVVLNQNFSYFSKLTDNQTGIWLADFNDILHFSSDTLYHYLSMKINKKTTTDYPSSTFDSRIQFTEKARVIVKDNYLFIDWWNHHDFTRTSVYLKKENKMMTSSCIIYGTNHIHAVPGRDVDFNGTNELMSVIYARDIPDLLDSELISVDSKKMLAGLFTEDFEENPMLEIFYLK
jgi:hypothetical protein